MIVIVAVLKAAEGKSDEAIEEFKKVIPKIRQDPGNLAYVLHRAVDDPTKLMVYEKYESREALQYHGQTEHFKEFGRATRDLFAGRPEITLYEEVA
jgi:quinol monooxygenase YgiN